MGGETDMSVIAGFFLTSVAMATLFPHAISHYKSPISGVSERNNTIEKRTHYEAPTKDVLKNEEGMRDKTLIETRESYIQK